MASVSERVLFVPYVHWAHLRESSNASPLHASEMYCPLAHGAHDMHSAVLLVGLWALRHRLATYAPALHCVVHGAHA